MSSISISTDSDEEQQEVPDVSVSNEKLSDNADAVCRNFLDLHLIALLFRPPNRLSLALENIKSLASDITMELLTLENSLR